MTLSPSNRIQAVQDPIIPIVGQWIRENPGTISLGQGVVWYGPPQVIENGIAKFNKDVSNHLYKAVHGIPGLLEVIETKLGTDNNIQISDAQRIVVTAGGNLAFSNAVLAIADPGDEFILSVKKVKKAKVKKVTEGLFFRQSTPSLIRLFNFYSLRPL